jgi:hypothetical protein
MPRLPAQSTHPRPPHPRRRHPPAPGRHAVHGDAIGIAHAFGHPGEGEAAGPCPGGEADPLQHSWLRHDDDLGAQVRELCRDDWLAPVGGPGCLRANSEAGAPVGQAEAPHAQGGLQLSRMPAAGLIAGGEGARRHW